MIAETQMLAMLWIVWSVLIGTIEALSLPSSQPSESASGGDQSRKWTANTVDSTAQTKSPWSSAAWRINLQINQGRRSNSDGGNGDTTEQRIAPFVLPLTVSVDSERYESDDGNFDDRAREFMGGSGACDVLTVVENAVYIPDVQSGQRTICFAPKGAWKLSNSRRRAVSSSGTSQGSGAGQGGVVKFWIDVLDPVYKRDALVISAPSRLYCTARCWRQTDYTVGLQRLAPYQQELQAVQDEIDTRLAHDTGDRRLDGTNLWDTALASYDMARLVQQRDRVQRQLVELREQYLLPYSPTTRSSSGGSGASNIYCSPPGHWPGSDEPLLIAQGAIVARPIAKTASTIGLFAMFQSKDTAAPQTIGTWTATPVNSKQ